MACFKAALMTFKGFKGPRNASKANIVNQTEGLQDFRRRQEGHLIIADVVDSVRFIEKHRTATCFYYYYYTIAIVLLLYKVTIIWHYSRKT